MTNINAEQSTKLRFGLRAQGNSLTVYIRVLRGLSSDPQALAPRRDGCTGNEQNILKDPLPPKRKW